ncbi:heme biosynthesis protein HemY, partial [Sulfitobacter sp. M23905]
GAPDTVVKGWLTRALNVSRGPQWICENCHHIHAEWVPICENCKSFDTLEWKTPPLSEVAMPSGVQMLPLIVGAPETTPTEGALTTRTEDIEEAELVTEPEKPTDPETPKKAPDPTA